MMPRCECSSLEASSSGCGSGWVRLSLPILCVYTRDAPDTDFAGYPAIPKAGYRISGFCVYFIVILISGSPQYLSLASALSSRRKEYQIQTPFLEAKNLRNFRKEEDEIAVMLWIDMRVLNIVYVNFSEKWKKTSMLAKKLRFVNTVIPVFFIITFLSLCLGFGSGVAF